MPRRAGAERRRSAPRVAEERVGREAADGGVDELDGMERGGGAARAPERGRDLDEAAGVAARVGVGAGVEHVPGLAVAEVRGRLGLDDVVDPGAAAADLLLGRLEALEAGDRVEQRARL